jgi:DNA-binding response OmpR family regulator
LKVLVVDDDAELRGLVGFALRDDGHEVVEAADGKEALSAFAAERPDLVILDVNMPALNGFEVLGKLRERSDVPVMMLTVRAGEEDQVRGLDLGADDYLAKPFSPRGLLARVRALSRRTAGGRPGPLECGDLVLDRENQTVRVRGAAPVRLTALEFALLAFLMTQPGRPASPERLARHIWNYRGLGDRTRLKQLVHRLRLKIEDDPANAKRLVTAPGVGYLLQPGQ